MNIDPCAFLEQFKLFLYVHKAASVLTLLQLFVVYSPKQGA